MTVTPWEYAATLNRLVDGDTAILALTKTFDFGFHITVTETVNVRVRLARINAPEIATAEGVVAKRYAFEWFAAHPVLRITTAKTDDYGRWLAEIYDATSGENLNDMMLSSGNAVRWP